MEVFELKKIVGFSLMLVIIIGCTTDTSEEPLETTNEPETEHSLEEKESIELEENVTTLAEKLTIPWSIAKYEDSFYVTERGGKLLRISENGQITNQELNLEREILHYGEGGLLGLLLHPNFAENNHAYIYHTYQEGDQIFNRVVLIENDGESWQEVEVLIDQIPGARFHNGGRIELGPDRKLYITTGDATERKLAQDQSSLAGKILRMDLDGTIPEDNPFNDSYVYSYGHRNPQGITWGDDGTMYSTEHGNSAHDEINIIEPGKNYGWPVIEGDQKR